jgi:hypothetical protein
MRAPELRGVKYDARKKMVTSPGLSVECCLPPYLCSRFSSFTIHM